MLLLKYISHYIGTIQELLYYTFFFFSNNTQPQTLQIHSKFFTLDTETLMHKPYSVAKDATDNYLPIRYIMHHVILHHY